MAEEEDVDETLDDYGEQGNTILALKRQLFCCSSSLITMFCAAIAMHREFDILVPSAQKNGIPSAISMPFVGDIIGAFMAMTLLHILGRRTSLLLGHILFIVPSVGVVAGLSPDREFYLIILIHMATRYFLVTFPVYFAEVTNHWVRGPLISSRYFLYDTGHILATHAFEKSTMGCLVVVVLQLVSLGISTLLPETPYYLALTGNRDDAEAQYDWLRGGGADPDERENMASRAEMDAEKAAGGMPIGVKTFLMPLMVICCMELGVFGSIPITYYVQTSIEHIHYYRPYVDFDDVVLGVNRFIVREEFIMLTMKLFGIFLVGVLPRRILYLSIALISMLCCTSYMYAGFNPQLIYQVVTAYKFIIFLGSEQLTHVSSAEIFPGLFRSFGISFSQIFRTGLDFMTLYTLHVPEYTDNYVLLSFGLIPFGFVMSFIFLPETFGRTLEEAEDTAGYVILGLFKSFLVTDDDEAMAEE